MLGLGLDLAYKYNAVVVSPPIEFPLSTNLSAYWKLDETSGTRIDSKNGFDLTDNGSVGFSVGKINNGTEFNNNYLSGTINNEFSSGFSISSWFKLNTVPTTIYVHIAGENNYYTEQVFRYGFQLENGTIRFYTSEITIYGPTISEDQWYHVVASVSNTEASFYVDGIMVGSVTTNNVVGNYNPLIPFTLGALQGYNEAFNGIIDEVGIWNRALTDAEVTRLYNNGNGLPYNQFF